MWIHDRVSDRCSLMIALAILKYLSTSALSVFLDMRVFVDLGSRYLNILCRALDSVSLNE